MLSCDNVSHFLKLFKVYKVVIVLVSFLEGPVYNAVQVLPGYTVSQQTTKNLHRQEFKQGYHTTMINKLEIQSYNAVL